MIKKTLKQELKAYNIAFASHFGRQPLKQDKEPLRPVYMHYQLIKQVIDHLAAEEAERSSAAAESSTPAAARRRVPSGTATTAKADATHSPKSTRRVTDVEKRFRKSRSLLPNEDSYASLSPAGARRVGSGCPGPRSLGQAKERRNNQLSACARQQQMQQRREEMTAQLHQLQRERRVLGDKLAAFNLRFKQETGRALRLKSDIAPVQHEYTLFVEITKQIDALDYALQKQAL